MRNFFVLLVLIFVFSGVSAQITLKSEYFGKSSYRLSEGDRDEKVGDSKGSAVVHQAAIMLPISLKVDEENRPTMWAINANGAYVDLHNENFTEPLVVDKVMNLSLGIIHLRPLNERWSMMAVVDVGTYLPGTQFSEIKFKNILGNAGAVFIYRLKPNLELGGGVALNNSFGYPMLFPAFYLNWEIDGHYFAKVSVLQGIKISAGYKVNENLSLNIIAEMNGQMALLEQDGKNKIFSHQYMIAAFQPEVKISQYITIPIAVGISAMRPAEINDRSIKNIFRDKEYYFQISPYLSAGLQVTF